MIEAFHCRRRLSLSPRCASRALLRMRTTGDFHRRWTLGGRGSFEIDGDVVEITPRAGARSRAIHLPGRLWDPAGTTMTGIDVEVHTAADDEVDVALSPVQRLPAWFRDDELAHWSELAHSALDELCEEMLWHASRDTDARAS